MPDAPTDPPPESSRRARWDLIELLVLFSAWATATALTPADGSRSFYEASAQVIPVIMLTLAIEARAFEWNLEWRGWVDRWNRGLDGPLTAAAARVLVLLFLIVAELLALSRLADPGALQDPQPKFVFGAMGLGFAAVALAAIPRRPRDSQARR
ncbi:hypothetical protein [Conexibacter sp. SYSU D00693]|uniref:hypothetical protein n=1 Tax=Conexibacter sp. SYSU D00693 TaxID=2812560 RepID=UPI00196B016D|nr:hypothetical protein [Conexibacter sp. SYSU D00693]